MDTDVQPIEELEAELSDKTLLSTLSLSSCFTYDCTFSFFRLRHYEFLQLKARYFDNHIYSHSRLRYDYDPSLSILRMWMPTSLHECVQVWASRMRNSFWSNLNRPYVFVANTSLPLPTTAYEDTCEPHQVDAQYQPESFSSTIPYPSFGVYAGLKRKSPLETETYHSRQRVKIEATMTKSPGAYFLPDGAPFPSVVFEIGWRDDAEELETDAQEWLGKTSGWTRVVIIVLLEEDQSNCPFDERWSEAEFLHAAISESQARKNVGTDELLVQLRDLNFHSHGQSFTTNTSNPGISRPYNHIAEKRAIDPDLWVGSIKARVTIWRSSEATGEAYQDGPPYRLYPNGTVRGPPPPKLRVCDVWGAGQTDSEATACQLDWKDLMKHIEDAKREYAVVRRSELRKYLKREFGFVL